MQAKKEIPEGAMIPTGYGFAWYDFPRNMKVCYPIPLHWIARVIRTIWWRVKYPGPMKMDELIGEMESKGFSRGYLLGHKDGMDEAFREVDRRIEAELTRQFSKE